MPRCRSLNGFVGKAGARGAVVRGAGVYGKHEVPGSVENKHHRPRHPVFSTDPGTGVQTPLKS